MGCCALEVSGRVLGCRIGQVEYERAWGERGGRVDNIVLDWLAGMAW